jgi:hypothetical protein
MHGIPTILLMNMTPAQRAIYYKQHDTHVAECKLRDAIADARFRNQLKLGGLVIGFLAITVFSFWMI